MLFKFEHILLPWGLKMISDSEPLLNCNKLTNTFHRLGGGGGQIKLCWRKNILKYLILPGLSQKCTIVTKKVSRPFDDWEINRSAVYIICEATNWNIAIFTWMHFSRKWWPVQRSDLWCWFVADIPASLPRFIWDMIALVN